MSKLGKKKSKRLDYFDAFERHAKLCLKEIKQIQECVEHFEGAASLKEGLVSIHKIENAADDVSHEVWDAIMPDFVTPIDREDIIKLTSHLDDLADKLEEIYQDFYMYDIEVMHESVVPFLELLRRECEKLEAATADFRNFKKSKTFFKSIDEVFKCEDEADVLYMDTIRSLHKDHHDDPFYVHVWTRIFETMEDCADQGEDIADLMHAIMLKNG